MRQFASCQRGVPKPVYAAAARMPSANSRETTMLTNLKVAMIIMAVLFTMMGVSFAFQIYGLQMQVDVLTVQVDGIKRSIAQKK
jgi:hypothetical protein